MAAYRVVYDSVTCRLTAKNRDQLRNLTLGNRVWATFTFLYWDHPWRVLIGLCIVAGEITRVEIKVIAVTASFAVIRWDKFNTSDERQLLSWIVNYREAYVTSTYLLRFSTSCIFLLISRPQKYWRWAQVPESYRVSFVKSLKVLENWWYEMRSLLWRCWLSYFTDSCSWL